MKRKFEDGLRFITDQLDNAGHEIRKRIRSLQKETELETGVPKDFLSLIRGENLFRLHEGYDSKSMRDEKDFMTRLDDQMFRAFPRSSLELATLPLVSMHGTIKVRGNFSVVFPVRDMSSLIQPPQPQDPLLQENLLLSDELEDVDWSRGQLGEATLETSVSDVQLHWRKPMSQRTPGEQTRASMLAETIKLWDLKFNDREIQCLRDFLKSHFGDHSPATSSIEQRGTFVPLMEHPRTLTFPVSDTYVFSYFVFLGEAATENRENGGRYPLFFRQCMDVLPCEL
jgi:hypothetical protein